MNRSLSSPPQWANCGAERAFAVRQGIKHVARDQHVVGARPSRAGRTDCGPRARAGGNSGCCAASAGAAGPTAGTRSRRPSPPRSPRWRRSELPEPVRRGHVVVVQKRHEVGTPAASLRRRPVARERDARRVLLDEAQRASAAWPHAPRTRPAPRHRRDCRRRSAARSPDGRSRSSTCSTARAAPAPTAWRGHRCKCRLPPETSAHSPPDGASASKKPQLSQATALRWRSLGRCRRPKNVMIGAYLKLGRNRNAE